MTWSWMTMWWYRNQFFFWPMPSLYNFICIHYVPDWFWIPPPFFYILLALKLRKVSIGRVNMYNVYQKCYPSDSSNTGLSMIEAEANHFKHLQRTHVSLNSLLLSVILMEQPVRCINFSHKSVMKVSSATFWKSHVSSDSSDSNLIFPHSLWFHA